MHANFWIILPFSLIGHLALWIGSFNRLHGSSLNNRFIRKASYPFFAAGLFVLPFVLYSMDGGFDNRLTGSVLLPTFGQGYLGCYLSASAVISVLTILDWGNRICTQLYPPKSLLRRETRQMEFSRECLASTAAGIDSFFATLPGNQIHHLSIEEREIRLPGLASCFDGLSITHLSDLHFTGHVCREYFDRVIDQALQLKSDMIVITGDIIDQKKCWSWLDDVLARLQARLGVYYILGNHDRRMGSADELRAHLNSFGFIDLGDRWHTIQIENRFIHLAGNELPWFGQQMTIDNPPDGYSWGDLRLLLSHSPDQWRWARENGFDLVLAGHTHGGQIRLPVIGPVIAPSVHGVKYASGMFEKDDKVMIVSRGISGEEPVRFNCSPELGKIIIRTSADKYSPIKS